MSNDKREALNSLSGIGKWFKKCYSVKDVDKLIEDVEKDNMV